MQITRDIPTEPAAFIGMRMFNFSHWMTVTNEMDDAQSGWKANDGSTTLRSNACGDFSILEKNLGTSMIPGRASETCIMVRGTSAPAGAIRSTSTS